MKMRHRRKKFWFIRFCELGEPVCDGRCAYAATFFMRSRK